MRAKINKDVRPFAGRTFDVIDQGEYRNGRKYVELDVTSGRTKFGLLGKTSSPRRYGLDEVQLIQEAK